MINMEENRERFFTLLLPKLEARGCVADDVIGYFDNSDFFEAPASSKYHLAVKGGLCQHCLNVYDNIIKLIEIKQLGDIISEDSATIVSLLHDLAKVNFYEIFSKNVKTYCEDGDKWDSGGKYRWETVSAYKIKDEKERYIFGNHEETSAYLASQLVPLSKDEIMSILKHHGGISFDSTPEGISEVYNASPLACVLHLADVLATFCDESINKWINQ